MNDDLRYLVIEKLRRGEALPPEWARELFPPEKREYELTYYGKEREEDIVSNTMSVPLQPVSTFGNGESEGHNWQNMLILGDNLQVLKTLLERKRSGLLCNADGTSGVRLIYIDPPFTTRQDFRGTQEQKAYSDKLVGVHFLEFLRKRLIMLKELLASDGSIFVHLDQRKTHYVKVIMDEIFGEHNFRNEIILPGRASKNLQSQFTTIARLNVRHDTLLWYSRTAQTRFSTFWVEKHSKGNTEGHWHHFWSTADRPTMRYELFGITPETGQWTWKEERAKEAIANYERYLEEAGERTLAEYWRDTGCTLRFIRQSPDDDTPQYWRAPATERVADTVWTGVPIYSKRWKYPTEKNEQLLNQIIDMASSEGDIVLDCFAGSGTTAAVAEKLNRRWVSVDSGKLAIYTIQKRMLSLHDKKEKKGGKVIPRPFTLYNAGLYDFSTLRNLPWDDWRFFALQLFDCKDEPHTVGGLQLDGKRQGASVLVFNHLQNPGRRIDEQTIAEIHSSVGDKIGRRFFIIAPRNTFDFQQDYLDLDGVRYYALRIPYSFINELHSREFTALQQPSDKDDVNAIVDAVGFDFIRPPKVEWNVGIKSSKDNSFVPDAYLSIEEFESRAYIRGNDTRGGMETLSLIMLDLDFNDEIFSLDKIVYRPELDKSKGVILLDSTKIGENVMAVFIDVYGNEARIMIPRSSFGFEERAPLVSSGLEIGGD